MSPSVRGARSPQISGCYQCVAYGLLRFTVGVGKVVLVGAVVLVSHLVHTPATVAVGCTAGEDDRRADHHPAYSRRPHAHPQQQETSAAAAREAEPGLRALEHDTM